MVRVLEQTSFGWMIKEKEIGKIVFIDYQGEEQIIKFARGETIPFKPDVMKNAVVFLANGEELEGPVGRVESLDLVRYILERVEDKSEVFTKFNSTIVAIPEILRVYRDVIENRVTKVGDNKFWKIINTPFEAKGREHKAVTVHDLPPIRVALINGLNTNF